jgi:histidine ammonia-lyase
MGMTAARHARACVGNAEMVVALEVLGAAQGLDLRAPLRPGDGSAAALAAVRSAVPFLEEDREIRLDIAAAVQLVRDGTLVDAVEAAVGALA